MGIITISVLGVTSCACPTPKRRIGVDEGPGRADRRLARRASLICTVLVAMIVVLVVLSGAVGSVSVGPVRSVQIVIGHLLPGMPWMSDGTLTPLQDQASPNVFRAQGPFPLRILKACHIIRMSG